MKGTFAFSVLLTAPGAGGHRAIGVMGPEDWRNGMAGARPSWLTSRRRRRSQGGHRRGRLQQQPGHAQFRDLLTNGHHDAVEQTGSGFAPTLPADTWFPPVITIDQVLTRNAVASSITTIDVTGSDHQSLLANISVPTVPVSAG